MFMNLLLLPSLLLSLEKSINNKEEFSRTLVELEPEPTDSVVEYNTTNRLSKLKAAYFVLLQTNQQ
jgi:hypothetical protein